MFSSILGSVVVYSPLKLKGVIQFIYYDSNIKWGVDGLKSHVPEYKYEVLQKILSLLKNFPKEANNLSLFCFKYKVSSVASHKMFSIGRFKGNEINKFQEDKIVGRFFYHSSFRRIKRTNLASGPPGQKVKGSESTKWMKINGQPVDGKSRGSGGGTG